jgi:hypothetical protein
MPISYEPGPEGQAPMYAVPKPPKKHSLKWLWIAPAVLLIALCLGGATIALFSGSGPKPGVTLPTIATTQEGAKPAVAAAAPIKPSDLQLTVKTTKKDCFGSAGCNVEYQIKAALRTGVKYAECNATYQVSGLEDPQVGTLNLHSDGNYEQDAYQSGSTSSSSKKLTAKVTEVDCD